MLLYLPSLVQADAFPFAREEPGSLSKNRQTSFNFRVGKALHTMSASHPRRETGNAEELRDLSWATWPVFGDGPWELGSILNLVLVQMLNCNAVLPLCSALVQGSVKEIKQGSSAQGIYKWLVLSFCLVPYRISSSWDNDGYKLWEGGLHWVGLFREGIL